MMGRRAGTVSSSGPSSRRNTRRFASSGSRRSTGSSSVSSPASTRIIVTAPITGFVVEAIRNREWRRTGGPATESRPNTSTCTESPTPTAATRPGTLSSPTCAFAISAKRSNPAESTEVVTPSLPSLVDRATRWQRRLGGVHRDDGHGAWFDVEHALMTCAVPRTHRPTEPRST